MAGKPDFTEEEWGQLSKGATGAGLLVAVSDRSFFDSFKEASSLAKHLAAARDAQSPLVRDLAGERPKGFGMTDSPAEITAETTEALQAAVATLRAKAPDEVEAYSAFVVDLARSVGKAAGGGDEAEAAAIEKIEAALA